MSKTKRNKPRTKIKKTRKNKNKLKDPLSTDLVVKNNCHKSPNTYKSFEKEYELSETFKNKRNIGINKEL